MKKRFNPLATCRPGESAARLAAKLFSKPACLAAVCALSASAHATQTRMTPSRRSV